MRSLLARHESASSVYDAPPGQILAPRKHLADRPRRTIEASFYRDLAVGHYLTGLERRHNRLNRFAEVAADASGGRDVTHAVKP
jgi:hypothetical protein